MARRGTRFARILAVVVVFAGVFVATAAALRFTDDSCRDGDTGGCKPPEGVVGTSYTHKLTGESGNGPPFSYILQGGSLPPGLSLNSSTGSISGRSAQSGTWTFGVELQDNPEPTIFWCKTSNNCAWQTFTINVLPGLSIETKSLPAGASVGVPYSVPLAAMLLTTLSPPAGTVPAALNWSVISGTLPPGLAIVNGVITGTPSAEGSYQFVVQAELDAQRKDTETLQIDVRAAVAIAAPPVPKSEVGVPFRMRLAATGGTGTFTWSLTAGVPPPGIALAADGTLTGTPRLAGTFRFTVGVADTEGRTASYAAVLNVAQKLAISTLRLRPGKVGRLYRAKLATRGGVPPTKWRRIGDPPPPGLSLDRTLGVLSGTPRREGHYRVTFEAVDALKVKSTKTFVIDVLA